MAGLAIITGATGGIGNQFVKSVCRFDDIDEIWAVGRNKEKLESLKNQYPKITAVEADFSKDGVSVIAELIKKKNPDVKMLINNAGIAYMGSLKKCPFLMWNGFAKSTAARHRNSWRLSFRI